MTQDQELAQGRDEQYHEYALLITLKRVSIGQSNRADALLLASELGLTSQLKQELDHEDQ